MRKQDHAPDEQDTSSRGEGKSGKLGPFLCWAVVFADLGTSVYYTPGILFQQRNVGPHAALFVGMTLVVFVLLTSKYAEVAVRYPEGGGVVTVTSNAIHPFAGVVGGMFILVDYFLTAALSAISGIIYLSDVFPALHPVSVYLPVTIGALVFLGLLNLVGVSESAWVNAAFATAAAISQVAVVAAVIIHVGPAHLISDLLRVFHGPQLTPLTILTGYAGAFLAFSGLESISQLSPVMAEPRQRVTHMAMALVVSSMALTSPLLTLWATTVLPITAHTDPNQVISLLAGYVTGRPLEIEVAFSGALLLVFASNTAVIGGYHVFIALARMGFLPKLILQRNRLRGTPHWAIVTMVAVPVAVLVATRGSAAVLGDLYAFGLLGAFTLTCLSLDLVRWHEMHRPRKRGVQERHGGSADATGPGRVGPATFAVGVLTTALVSVAWFTNLFAKPMATLFGGGVTVVGLLFAFTTYALGRRQGRPFVFPLLHGGNYPVIFLRHGRRARPPAKVLAILPRRREQIDALVQAASRVAADGPIVFVEQGTPGARDHPPTLFEIINPYLDDPRAQESFAQAERLAHRQGLNHRYLYVPSTAEPDAVSRFWHTLRPEVALVVSGEEGLLADIPAQNVYRTDENGVPIMHYQDRAEQRAS